MESEYFFEMSQESELNDALAIFLADSAESEEKKQREAVNFAKGRSPIDFHVEEGSSKSYVNSILVIGEKRSHAAANNKATYNNTVSHLQSGEQITEFPLTT